MKISMCSWHVGWETNRDSFLPWWDSKETRNETKTWLFTEGKTVGKQPYWTASLSVYVWVKNVMCVCIYTHTQVFSWFLCHFIATMKKDCGCYFFVVHVLICSRCNVVFIGVAFLCCPKHYAVRIHNIISDNIKPSGPHPCDNSTPAINRNINTCLHNYLTMNPKTLDLWHRLFMSPF